MIGHLFKLVWNRRRANALILIELFISFVGLCVILTIGFSMLHYYTQPLGFDYEDVWRVDLDMPNFFRMSDEQKEATWSLLSELELMLENSPDVSSFTPLMANVPFSYSSSGYTNYVNGQNLFVRNNRVHPEAIDTLRLELIAGRWLEPGDEALDSNPVVVTRNYAEMLYGRDDPIGKTIIETDENGEPADSDGYRIVGMVESWRKDGEMNPAPPCQFALVQWGLPRWPPMNYLVRVKPGTPAVYEEELTRAVQQIGPTWTVNVARLADDRDRILRDSALPLIIGGAVSVFLIIMVGLGLMGVLWQNVTRRTEELGVRRALGATARGIRWQILGELLALTSVAIAAGALIYAQLPLFRLVSEATVGVYALSFSSAVASIYLVVTLCGLYPSWLATRVQPAEALQYE